MELRLRSIRRHVLLFFSIIRFEAQRYKHYPQDFVVSVLARFTGAFLLAIFWFVIAETNGTVLDTKFFIGYYLVVAGLDQMIVNFGVSSTLIRKIKFGFINASLVRPLGVFFFEYARNIGWVIQFYLIAIGFIIAGVNLVGADVNWLVVTATFICALLINIAINMLIASIAFYVHEATGIKNTTRHILRLAQGFMIPLSLMPLALQNLLFLSPFAASLYLPTIALLGEEVEGWKMLFGAIWGILLLIIARAVWARALKRYEAVGI